MNMDASTILESQAKFWSAKAKVNFINPVNLEKVLEFIPDKNAKILEYGCGYGRVLNILYNAGYTHLYGIDFSQDMIARGLEENKQLNLFVNDGIEVPFENESFDAVCLFTVLTCIHSDVIQQKIVAEIKRVLKKGGILYLSDFLIADDERNLKRYAEYQDKYGCYGVFELEGCGVCRHHTLSYIKTLLADFELQWFTDEKLPTLSGNPAQSFQLIASYF